MRFSVCVFLLMYFLTGIHSQGLQAERIPLRNYQYDLRTDICANLSGNRKRVTPDAATAKLALIKRKDCRPIGIPSVPA